MCIRDRPSYSEHDAWRIETFDKNFLFCFYFRIEIIMAQYKINLSKKSIFSQNFWSFSGPDYYEKNIIFKSCWKKKMCSILLKNQEARKKLFYWIES